MKGDQRMNGDPVLVKVSDHGSLVLVPIKHGLKGRTLKYTFQSQLAVVLFNTTATSGLRAALSKVQGNVMARNPFTFVRKNVLVDLDLGDREVLCDKELWVELVKWSQQTKDPIDRSSKLRMMRMIPVKAVAMLCNLVGKIPRRAESAAALLDALGENVPKAVLEARPKIIDVDVPDLVPVDEVEDEASAVAALANEETTTFVPFFEPASKKKSSYALSGKDYTKTLDGQLKAFTAFRLQKINAKRQGCAVVQTTVDCDIRTGLRVLGYFKHKYTGKATFDEQFDLRLFARPDFGNLFVEYTEFLEANELSWGTIANYTNSCMMLLQYVHRDKVEFQPSERALYRIRQQCEKTAKHTRRYKDKHAEYIDWYEAQDARIQAIEMWEKCDGTGSKENKMRKAKKLRDALIISFWTATPPDRVGVIRKLRLYKTIIRDKQGHWFIDLRDVNETHKTSKFYGPSYTPVSKLIAPLLDAWTIGGARAVVAESDSDRAMDSFARLYLFPTSSDSRCYSSSNWTSVCKAAFKRVIGKAPPPSLLRASYITFVRTHAPDDVLKQSAKFMKHCDETQGSRTYDQKAFLRQTQKAVDFTTAWCERYDEMRMDEKAQVVAKGDKTPPKKTSEINVDMTGWDESESDDDEYAKEPPKATAKFLAKVKKRAERHFKRRKSKARKAERRQRKERRGIGNTTAAAVARFMRAYKARQEKKRREMRQPQDGKATPKAKTSAKVSLEDMYEEVDAKAIQETHLVVLRSEDAHEPVYLGEVLTAPEGEQLTTELHWYGETADVWRPLHKTDAATGTEAPWTQQVDLKDSALHWGPPDEVLCANHKFLPAVLAALLANPSCLLGNRRSKSVPRKKKKPRQQGKKDNTHESSSSTDLPQRYGKRVVAGKSVAGANLASVGLFSEASLRNKTPTRRGVATATATPPTPPPKPTPPTQSPVKTNAKRARAVGTSDNSVTPQPKRRRRKKGPNPDLEKV